MEKGLKMDFISLLLFLLLFLTVPSTQPPTTTAATTTRITTTPAMTTCPGTQSPGKSIFMQLWGEGLQAGIQVWGGSWAGSSTLLKPLSQLQTGKGFPFLGCGYWGGC